MKVTNNRRMATAKSHGFYLQHARGGLPASAAVGNVAPRDVETRAVGQRRHLRLERRGQRPEADRDLRAHRGAGAGWEVPPRIFARKNSLRDYWVSVGSEVTGMPACRRRTEKAFEEQGSRPGR